VPAIIAFAVKRVEQKEEHVTRIKRDTIAYLLIVGFCIVMMTWAIPTYTPPYPGYGASPALVSYAAVGIMLVMAILSLISIAIFSYTKKPMPVEESTFPEEQGDGGGFTQVGRVKLYHLASIMIPSVLFVVAIEYIGYLLASFAYLMILQYVIGSRKWIQSVVLAVVLTAVLYIVMRYGFSVPVPGPQIF